MKNTLAFILVILLCSCVFAQETFFTSGQGLGVWNDPHSWMLGENGPIANRIPHPEANIVIRHSLTYSQDQSYTHHGNIEVKKGSTFELMGSGSFTYAGDLFELNGTLISALDVHHKSNDASPSNFVIRNTGLVYALKDFHTDFGSEILIEQPVCGALYIYGDLQIHGRESRILGAAKIISGGVKAWTSNGEEIQGDQDVNAFVSHRMGNNIELFQSEGDCEYGNSMLVGLGNHIPGIDLLGFDASLMDKSIQVSLATKSIATLPDFYLERAWEGEEFMTLADIPATSINETQGYFKVDDKESPDQERKYRLTYVNELGEKVVLGVINVGGGPQIAAYPNPFQGESLSIQMQGFKASETLSVKIMDLQGRSIWEDKVESNGTGNMTYQVQPELQAGTYLIFVESSETRKSQRLLVF